NHVGFMKKIVLLIVLLLTFQYFTFSQESHLSDSLQNILKTAEEDSGKAALLIRICSEKWKYAEYAEAKKYADAALLLSGKIGFKNGVAEAYNQTGIVYWYVKDNLNALVCHQKALSLYEQSGNKTGISNVLNRMGHDYADMYNYPMALEYFEKALHLDEELDNQNGVSKNLDLIGFVYMKQSDFPKALDYYFKAAAIAEAIGSKRGISAVSHDIGEVYEKQNKLDEALKYALKGLTLALEIGEKHLIEEAYEGLEKIYLKMHNYQEAYNIRTRYDEIENFLRNTDNAGKIKQMQMEYEFDKKQVSDSLKIVKEKEIGEIKLQKLKAYTYMGFAAVAITILFLIFVYRSYSKQRMVNQKLKEAQQQLIRSEKMAAFGIMAKHVSHEILNPLNFMNNFSQISSDLTDEVIASTSEKEKEEITALIKENLTKIKEHGNRAAAIVSQLQELGNKGAAHEFFEKKKDS
ncbi:MAG: tetratricopeptide repeat protein, partial [Bacteroidota bacterium]